MLHPPLCGSEVDFVSFITPDKGGFAVVNMRLCHLEFGNVIVVAPHKDGTFRSLQVKGENMTEENIFDVIGNDILKRKNVIELLTEDGVI